MSVPEGGKDVQLLRAFYHKNFEIIANSVSEERFIELFRDLLGSKSRCKKLHSVVQANLTEDLNKNLDEIIEEENLDAKFAEKAELLQKQKEFEGTTAWRPTGDPAKDQRSHDMHVLLNMKGAMEEYVKAKEANVDQLLQEVRIAHKAAADLQATISATSKKVADDSSRLSELEEGYLKVLEHLAPDNEDIK